MYIHRRVARSCIAGLLCLASLGLASGPALAVAYIEGHVQCNGQNVANHPVTLTGPVGWTTYTFSNGNFKFVPEVTGSYYVTVDNQTRGPYWYTLTGPSIWTGEWNICSGGHCRPPCEIDGGSGGPTRAVTADGDDDTPNVNGGDDDTPNRTGPGGSARAVTADGDDDTPNVNGGDDDTPNRAVTADGDDDTPNVNGGDDDQPTGTRRAPGLPAALTMRGAAPNPFRDAVRVFLSAPSGAEVSARVFDIRGTLVRELAAGRWGAGDQAVTWDGRNQAGSRVSAGVYFVRVTAAGRTGTMRVAFMP